MSPPRKVPADDVLRAQAPAHPSIASLARALGVRANTLGHALGERNLTNEIKGLLRSSVALASEDDGPSAEEILTARVAELEAELRRRRRTDVFTERVAMAVTDAVEARGIPKFTPPPPKKKSAKPAEHEFVLLWSDTHYGEVVSSEETNSLNEYDPDICWRRHLRMRDAIFSYADNRPYEVERLHVLALGDMLSGSIHAELKETNQIPLAEAAVEFADKGAEWLASLGERFRRVEFAGIVGNHPRFDQKPRAKTGFDNADWITYHQMALMLRENPRFHFDIPKANAHIHRVFDRNVLMFHGDSIRSSMPGVPWGGVMRRATTLHAQYAQAGIPIDLYTCGHFHQRALVKGPGASRIAMNGSPKGVDEYSLKAFGGGEVPGQLLLTYHRKHGLTDASYIDL